jgi:hypothetical protein
MIYFIPVLGFPLSAVIFHLKFQGLWLRATVYFNCKFYVQTHDDDCVTDTTAPENKMSSPFPCSSYTFNHNIARSWYSMHIHIKLCYIM